MASKITPTLFNIFKGRLLCSVGTIKVGFSTDQRCHEINWKMPKHQFSSTKSTNITPIHICIAQEHDHDRLLDFLRIHFYPEEPLTIGKEPIIQEPIDEEYTMSSIKYNTSLMALRRNRDEEQVVGAALASPKDCHELERLLEHAAKYSPKSKWGSVVHLLVRIERETDVFERFRTERVLHVHALGVHKETRGISLGARLMQELMALGKTLKYELMTIDCSSVYSAQLCERLGMECINVVWYDDYLDEDGNQIIQPPPPHSYIKTYAKRLLDC